jgi:hypothetical protein
VVVVGFAPLHVTSLPDGTDFFSRTGRVKAPERSQIFIRARRLPLPCKCNRGGVVHDRSWEHPVTCTAFFFFFSANSDRLQDSITDGQALLA